jgi:hypothetical protein
MAKYYKYTTVNGTSGGETTAASVASTDVEPKHISKIYVYESTATRNNDATVRVYVERERIVDAPIKMFLDLASTPTYPLAAGVFEVDFDLPVGQTLYVGHVSGSTASNITFVIEYELTK